MFIKVKSSKKKLTEVWLLLLDLHNKKIKYMIHL